MEPLESGNTMHQRRSSINASGERLKVRIADVKGFFTSWRQMVAWVLLLVYLALPWLKVNGQPALFLDILRRHFYFFGMTFNAQDATIMFFFLAGGLLTLILLTSLVGRVWCGWACPQTVFLEGVFRKIERMVEGPNHRQLQLEKSAWDSRKIFLMGLKHGLYLLAALVISHAFISYFVSLDQLRHWVLENPEDHWTAFVWMGAITAATYGNFAWFREQTCMILCPYGRLQSVLTDDDSLVIGYDEKRGEPRGPRNSSVPEAKGDCVNCMRCVDVCPVGIDIREGLQLECIACANCVDACDDIMRRLKRPEGLIRYDSLKGLQGQPARLFRPRVLIYMVLWIIFVAASVGFVSQRRPFEATLMRQQGMPYVLEAGNYRNSFYLHLFNKTPREARFRISLVLPDQVKAVLPVSEIVLPSLSDAKVPAFVEIPKALWKGEFEVIAKTSNMNSGAQVESSLRFLGPR